MRRHHQYQAAGRGSSWNTNVSPAVQAGTRAAARRAGWVWRRHGSGGGWAVPASQPWGGRADPSAVAPAASLPSTAAPPAHLCRKSACPAATPRSSTPQTRACSGGRQAEAGQAAGLLSGGRGQARQAVRSTCLPAPALCRSAQLPASSMTACHALHTHNPRHASSCPDHHLPPPASNGTTLQPPAWAQPPVQPTCQSRAPPARWAPCGQRCAAASAS